MKHMFLFLLLAGQLTAQTVTDPGFEIPAQGQGKFTYKPTGSAWTFTGSSALAGNGSAFTTANPVAPEGLQVAVLQKVSQVSQTVTGWPAGKYQVSFQAAQRAGGSQQRITVLVDGQSVGDILPSGTTYDSYSSSTFTVTAGDHTVALQGTNVTGDNTALVDGIVIGVPSFGPPLLDPGFEVPAVGYGKFVGQPVGSAWTWKSGGGLSANASGFTQGNPVSPQGNQVAFLQGAAEVSQSVNFAEPGSYIVSLKAAQRNYPQPYYIHTFNVVIDDQVAATITPAGITYETYYVMLPPITAGNHVLTLRGAAANDYTVFLDAVKILTAVTTPVSINDAWIGSSGKTLGFHFTAGIPTQTISVPTLNLNNVTVAALGPPALLAGNEVLLFPLPQGVVVKPGDVATVSTPPVWQNTTAGLVAPVTGLSVDNRVGRSSLPPSAIVPKKFMPGVNNNTWPTGVWGNYYPFANWAFKCNWPPGVHDKLRGSVTLPIYSNAGANSVDSTGYPGPAGLWMVYWKSSTGPKGEEPASFTLTTKDPAGTAVKERKDLANPSAPNGYQARVYDFQHTTTSTTANIDVALVTVDSSNTGNYSDLWVVGPGDFDTAPNVPVTFDTRDPFALSRTYTQWIPQSVGSLRWVDSSNCGGNPVSCPYPELLMTKADKGWGQLAGHSVRWGYTALGPVDTQATPWQYSPFYRKDTEQFTATLTQDITTTPVVGTNETYTFSDADTAPLMAGLEITLDSEICRIISVSGSSVRLYRGSNGTTPTAHAAGMVKVSGRRPIQVAPDGTANDAHTYQLMTDVPHGQTTATMAINTVGLGWPTVTWSDGSTTGRIDARPPLVTGPRTLVQIVGPAVKGGAKPTQVYTLDPKTCYSEVRFPGGYIPPEVTAIATGKFPKAALHVNINSDACDDFVWHYMRLIRDNFPAGRSVIVEYTNEPWNFGFSSFGYVTQAAYTLGYENPYPLSYYVRRSGEVGNIARAAFKETGRDGEIKLMLNCQLGSDQPKDHLTYAAKNGWQVDRIGNAPYLMIDTGKNAFATWDDDQLCDLWPMFLWFDKRANSYNSYVATARNAIADYNKTMGNDGCALMGYEGGIECAVPPPDPNQWLRSYDLVYNPNWYWMEDTFYRWCQRQGFVNLHVYSLSQYHSPNLWGMYHWPRHKPGYGDGRNGGTDNRLRLARPGQPNTKPANVNVDYNDSVRGQVFIDWLAPPSPPPTIATEYTVTAPDPASGQINVPSGNFTVQPNGLYTGTITITPKGGGLSAPVVLTWVNTSEAKTFTITPTEPGSITLGATNSGGLKDPEWLGRWFLEGQAPAPVTDAQPKRKKF